MGLWRHALILKGMIDLTNTPIPTYVNVPNLIALAKRYGHE